MFTQTFTYTNTDSDPDLIDLRTFASTDTTDTTASGYANSLAVYQAFSEFSAQAQGFVDLVAGDVTAHRVTFMKVWDTEADRDAALVALHANATLFDAYHALLNRFRTEYNVTTDPAPNQAPHYFP